MALATDEGTRHTKRTPEEMRAYGRRVLRARGRPLDPPPPPRASLRRRLRDGTVSMLLVTLLGGSTLAALWPDPFMDEAPIRVADTVLVAGAAGETGLAPDPAPTTIAGGVASPAVLDERSVGTLGEAPAPAAPDLGPVRGTVGQGRPSIPGGAKVIDVPAEGRPRSTGPIVITDPSDLRQNPRLAHLPDRALVDESDAGPLPVRAGARRPFDVYAGRWSGRRGNRIAVVVGGIGISQSGTKSAIERLPGKVTLAFSPEGNSLRRWMQAARRDGHELLVQVPMQAFGREGADTRGRRLTVDATAAENGERLRRSLGRLTNYVGVVNYRGGAFQADVQALDPVMREIRDRGLMYLDDGTSGQSQAVRVARDTRTPFAGADVLIDARRDPSAIAAELERVEKLARGTGRAIAVATAFPESVEALARWIEGVESRGFEIVPVSALADDPGAPR